MRIFMTWVLLVAAVELTAVAAIFVGLMLLR
jgi:hypothetical protein